MMKLYSHSTNPLSHRCRIVLFEKGMDFEVIDVDMDNKPDELTTLSPYVDSPVLIERNLVLTDPNIINEYIDERFPHPQLMPPDPIMRARARLFLKDFENQLFIHMTDLEGADAAKKNKAIKNITEGLLQLVPILNKQPYLLYDEYSMLDVAMAPLLWRLDHYGIKLPSSAKPLMKYADSLFNRPLFDEAMTPAEKAMR
ncbi:stringent starvation protein A [Methylophilales bacterium MBRSG12]|jgi:RNA polymerase-associated protein|uniref:Stringent starvation protein A n=1 Tax=Methylophilales bacterium MBRS-H7 TaxID=1623450 RepID=A0A0H4J0M8_9PROT|nr:stringent starvation protein A [Methylophilales bacterium MBRSF5]AKO65630.1 stringent starvation protein A [Methylophilales bacterium MBRS-H7]AKO66951.1 stringent starvation protein A [Methylophilales bacterium MBRSG12]